MGTTSIDWPGRAASVAHEVLAAYADDVDRAGRWPAESITALSRAGFLGLTVPEEFGGACQGPRTFVAMLQALAEQCASTAMIYLMHVCAVEQIKAAPAFALRERVLRDAAAGKHLSTLAVSEKGSRSHFWVAISKARVEGTGCRLNADKSFVTSAGHADSYVVSSGSATATGPMQNTLYFVAAGTPGLTVTGNWNGLGLRGNASGPMRLEEVAVPASHRLSDEGNGVELMMQHVLPWFQIGTAAVAVGIARSATESIRRHLLGTRLEHLDQSLAALPTLRARLAQMQIAVDTQQAFLGHAVSKMENPGPDTLLALLEVKAAAAEAALEVTDLAMRAGGGACFGKKLSVERNFRDARAGWVMAPTTDVLYDFIGKTLLDMPLF